jgi:hypothetical protein
MRKRLILATALALFLTSATPAAIHLDARTVLRTYLLPVSLAMYCGLVILNWSLPQADAEVQVNSMLATAGLITANTLVYTLL